MTIRKMPDWLPEFITSVNLDESLPIEDKQAIIAQLIMEFDNPFESSGAMSVEPGPATP